MGEFFQIQVGKAERAPPPCRHCTHCTSSPCSPPPAPGCLFTPPFLPLAKDDYLDLFGDPSVTGKIGTDIQDNKCSWLVVQCLQRATPEQRQILQVPQERTLGVIRKAGLCQPCPWGPVGAPRQFLQVFCLMLETGMLLILL